MAFEVGGTTPASESLGSEEEYLDRAYVDEEGGMSELTRRFFPGVQGTLFKTDITLLGR